MAGPTRKPGARRAAPTMDSSSPEEEAEEDWSLYRFMKKLGGDMYVCKSCRKPYSSFRDTGVEFCGECRTAMYCSVVCKTDHWQKCHKNVCRKRIMALAVFREDPLGTNFSEEFHQWVRSEKVHLFSLALLILEEAAVDAESKSRSGANKSRRGARKSRPGASKARSSAPVIAEEIACEFCVLVRVDYKPKFLYPFRVRDDYELVLLDTLEGTNLRSQEYLRGMRDAGDRDTQKWSTSSGKYHTVHILLQAGDKTEVMMAPVTRVSPWYLSSLGKTVADDIDLINVGSEMSRVLRSMAAYDQYEKLKSTSKPKP